MQYQPYPIYKPSGVEWLDDIPVDWKTLPLFTLMTKREQSARGSGINSVLSLSYGHLIIRDVESNFGLLPESFDTYQVVKLGNLILRLTDLQNDQRSLRVGQAHQEGIITSAYQCLAAKKELDTSYAYYLLHGYDLLKIFYGLGGGVRQSLKYEDLKRLTLLYPRLAEQHAIAAFLDRETAKIDALIAKQQAMIALLREKRQAVISHAVTKGLNPDAPMKPSGVEWLGDVPEGWEVKRLKMLAVIKRGASPRPIDDPRYFDEDGEYSWVRISDVTASNKYLLDTEQKLSALGASLSICLRQETLVLSIAASVGKPIITRIPCCIHDGFICFLELKMNREYLYYIFLSEQPYKGLGKLGTQLNLNSDTIGNILVPLPSLLEQRAIATFLNRETAKIDALIAKQEQMIVLLQEHRSSLITAAVTGKIDVRQTAVGMMEQEAEALTYAG